jgi:hypothetical protein
MAATVMIGSLSMEGTTGSTLLVLEVVIEVVVKEVVEWVLKAVAVGVLFLATIRLTCIVTST